MPTGPVDHLHFICSDSVYYPRRAKECVLIVNISSIDDGSDYDKTCILNVGDHPFIKHASYIYYKRAEIYNTHKISQEVSQGNFRIHEPCKNQIFERIVNGFEISEEVPIKISKFLEFLRKHETTE